MKWLALSALVAVACVSSTAEARGRFLLDVAPGVAVPIADGNWQGTTDPSFKLSLRFGGELWFTRVIGMAGEVDLDLEPLMVASDSADARVRGLVGLRLLFGFPRHIGAFFLRQAIGVDYISPNASDVPLDVRDGQAALAVEPGLGLQFHFVRRGVVGFAVDFPIGFFDHLLAADVQFLGFIGARI